MPKDVRHDLLSETDELSPEKDRFLERQPGRIVAQEEDVQDDSEDGFDDVFGVSSRRPRQFTSMNNKESQERRSSQIRVSVCYKLYYINTKVN